MSNLCWFFGGWENLVFCFRYLLTFRIAVTIDVILEKCKQQKNPEQNTEQTNPINVTALKPSKHRKSFISTVLGIHYELLGHKNERQK